MQTQVPRKCNVLWNSVSNPIALAAIAATLLMPLRARTQSAMPVAPPPSQATPQWQIAAGGSMSFEVASIRPGDPDKFISPTFGLNIDDSPIPPGGNFTADFPLPTYIEFAYKIMLTREQRESMLAHLPKWAATQPFVIVAKAPTASATKDQMRLMIQSLLTDRFKLAAHFEAQDQPALALIVVKEGKTGPRLRPHAEGLACDAKWSVPADPASPAVHPGEFLPSCGVVQVKSAAHHTILLGARNLPLPSMAAFLAVIPPVMDFGRPVIDQTGLKGMYDFSLNWLPDPVINSPGASEPSDAQGPTFEEALKDQLGLKLKPTRAVVQILVVDHVEQPSPN